MTGRPKKAPKIDSLPGTWWRCPVHGPTQDTHMLRGIGGVDGDEFHAYHYCRVDTCSRQLRHVKGAIRDKKISHWNRPPKTKGALAS